MTTEDIQGLIALAITNNRVAFINALAANGYVVRTGISDEDLYVVGLNILNEKGAQATIDILNRVQLNKTALSEDQKSALRQKFSPALRGFGDWFNDTVTYVGDLLGGHSTTTTPVTNVQSTSALSPFMLGLIVTIGIILMVIFRKSIALVIAIIVVVMAVVIYGVFAKNITSSTTPGSTQTHGGIGAALLSLFGI